MKIAHEDLFLDMIPSGAGKGLEFSEMISEIQTREATPPAGMTCDAFDEECRNDITSLLSAYAPAAGARQETLSKILRGYEIFTRLSSRSVISVAASTEDDVSFGIGHMLHAIRDKNLFARSRDSISDIVEDLLEYSILDGGAPITTRYAAILALKKIGAICPYQSDKAYKPVGTCPSPKEVLAFISDRRNIPVEDIVSAKKTSAIVTARFRTIFVMRHVCGQSLTAIGRHVGGKDHTTIMNSLNRLNVDIEKTPAIRKEVELLCEGADMIGVIRSRAILARQA